MGDGLRDETSRALEDISKTQFQPPVMIGASHSWAIDRAARAAGIEFDQINFWNFRDNPRLPDLSDLTPQVKKRILGRSLFSTIGGALPAQLSLLRHPKPFDFIVPERPDLALDKGAEILPFHTIHSAVKSLAKPNLVALRYTSTAAGGAFHHIGLLPPLADDALIKPHVMADAVISSAAFRYKIWLVYTDIIRSEVMALGGTYIPPPAEITDDRGYLLVEFHQDAVHGNDGYGALVVKQLLALNAIGRN